MEIRVIGDNNERTISPTIARLLSLPGLTQVQAQQIADEVGRQFKLICDEDPNARSVAAFLSKEPEPTEAKWAFRDVNITINGKPASGAR